MVDGITEQTENSRPGRSKAARIAYIGKTVTDKGFVTVDSLAEVLRVSRMTIHRDLDELQESGKLRKIHGGATAERSMQYESELSYRANMAVEEKKLIGQAAAKFVQDGHVVLLDDSTTALHVLPHITERSQLTIITNFMEVVERTKAAPHVKLIALGGEYVPRYDAFFGVVTEDNLKHLHADVLLVSASAMRGKGIYHQDQRVVTVKRAMIEAAENCVLLMNSAKLGHTALHKICDLDQFNHVVVDEGIDASTVREIESAGPAVLIAQRGIRALAGPHPPGE